MENLNQQLSDDIICYQNAIRQIDEKITLIKFIGSVNNSFVPEELLNINELTKEKSTLQKNLKILKVSYEVRS